MIEDNERVVSVFVATKGTDVELMEVELVTNGSMVSIRFVRRFSLNKSMSTIVVLDMVVS